MRQSNPVAAALMAKMQIDPADRPKVKAECLRLLVTLQLDPARMQLISGFVDTYLTMTPDEETTFNLEIGKIETSAQEQVMEIVTSWMERGIAQGLEQGRQEGLQEGQREGELKLLLLVLNQLLGPLSPLLQAQVRGLTVAQIEQVSDRMSTLTTPDDLANSLNELEAVEGFTGLRAQTLNQLRQAVGVISPDQKQRLLSLSSEQLQALHGSSSTFAASQDLGHWLEQQVS